jgi:hypothetical protein
MISFLKKISTEKSMSFCCSVGAQNPHEKVAVFQRRELSTMEIFQTRELSTMEIFQTRELSTRGDNSTFGKYRFNKMFYAG